MCKSKTHDCSRLEVTRTARHCALAALTIFVLAFSRTALADFPTLNTPTEAPRPTAAPFDAGGVRQTGFQQPTPAALPAAATEKQLMLPARPSDGAADRSSSGPRTLGAFVSVLASLAIVLGLFFVVAWFMRRSLPTSARRLPADVVETLGRAPLSGRQQMHVLRFGNKLLLVSVSPTGADTLAEITDPAEIDRVAALCAQSQSSGPSFKQIFDKLSADKRGSKPTPSNRAPRNPMTRTSALSGEATDV
jgi:flagellar biogenesis protein FliO